jgi:hypothetical protein
MKITFSKHAKLKFVDLAEHGFKITKEQIEDALNNPEGVIKDEKDRLIAQRAIDETHIIRVIYRKEGDLIKVITFYPARRRRYES